MLMLVTESDIDDHTLMLRGLGQSSHLQIKIDECAPIADIVRRHRDHAVVKRKGLFRQTDGPTKVRGALETRDRVFDQTRSLLKIRALNELRARFGDEAALKVGVD